MTTYAFLSKKSGAGGGGGSGTVTSVGLLDGSTSPIYAISGSPVTTSGTLVFTLSNQSANLVFAGPATGVPAQPTFRSIVAADLPATTVLSMGAFGSTPNANGASIAAQVLTLQPANATNPGGVLPSTQSFGGGKTIIGNANEIQFTITPLAGQTANILSITSPDTTPFITANATKSLIVGDPGTEGAGLNFDGSVQDAVLKVSFIEDTSHFVQQIISRNSAFSEPVLAGARSNVNSTALVEVTAGQAVFSIYGAGVTGSGGTQNYKPFANISLAASSTGTISGTSSPGQIIFRTTPDGTTVATPTLTLDQDKSALFAGTSSVLTSSIIRGSTSGAVSINTQAAAGTFNFNLPITAGTSGFLLTSAGGAASPMTWTDPATFQPAFSGFTTNGAMYALSGSTIASTAVGTQYQSLVSNGGGSPPSFQAVSLDQAAAISGSLPVTNGGTGVAALTANNILVGAGTSDVAFIAPSGTSGLPLLSNGAGVDPSFAALDLSNTSAVSNALTVPNGGTGQTTLTDHGVLLGSGTAAIDATAVGATGTVLIGNTSADPAFSATPTVTTLTASTSMTSPVIYGSSSASGDLTLDSTSNATKGNVLLNPTDGFVAIGPITPDFDLTIARVGNPSIHLKNQNVTKDGWINMYDDRLSITSSDQVVLGTGNNTDVKVTLSSTLLNSTVNFTTAGCVTYNGGSIGTCLSDIRLKKDVKSFELGLKDLIELKPVLYKYNGLAGTVEDGNEKIGLIAQEVEKVNSDLIEKEVTKLNPNEEDVELLKVKYGHLLYMAINAIKELNDHINGLEDQLKKAKLLKDCNCK